MADEKKTVKKEDTSKAEKTNPAKKVGGFFAKIGKAIAKFFKDLKGETKKIVWPGRQMVLKSTGIVLAAILVIGAGIWIIDFAVSGAVTGLGNLADQTEETTVETTEKAEESAEEEHDHDHEEESKETEKSEKDKEETTESTTEA